MPHRFLSIVTGRRHRSVAAASRSRSGSTGGGDEARDYGGAYPMCDGDVTFMLEPAAMNTDVATLESCGRLGCPAQPLAWSLRPSWSWPACRAASPAGLSGKP